MNLDWSDMPIHEAIKADWRSPEILIEGSLNSAKTTLMLDKEIDAVFKWPGIPILLFRWSGDAVDTKLKPAFEELLAIRGITEFYWDAKPKCYQFENGSRVYCFGLQSISAAQMFHKIRGLGVSRIAGDQVEEMEPAVAGELRGRLRPNLTATMNARRFPFQLTFVANPEDTDFWLSKEFPADNRVKGRRLYSLSVFDNKHLPPESVESLLRQFPPEHPKHQTMVLGQRGPNITGVPVFEKLYNAHIHRRAVFPRVDAPLLEAFEFGKHNPAWVYGQQTYAGGLILLGGIRAQELALEDFLPIVKQYRKEWFPDNALQKLQRAVGQPAPVYVRTCTSPMGDKATQVSSRFTGLEILRRNITRSVAYRDNGNARDVRLGLIESLSGYLRRRTTAGDEAIGISDDLSHWLVADRDGVRASEFLHIAFEAGYTWDKHFVSVSSKEIKQPHEDDKFANVMHCVEDIILNFCANSDTDEERERRASAAHARAEMGGGSIEGEHAWMGY